MDFINDQQVIAPFFWVDHASYYSSNVSHSV